MNFYVADTHALLWYLLDSSKLGANASSAFDEADQGQAIIYLPSIVIAELYFSVKKFNYQLDFAGELAKLRRHAQFEFVSFDAFDALDFDKDALVTEMHDRIIVGVARRINASLLTRDTEITTSGLLKVIW